MLSRSISVWLAAVMLLVLAPAAGAQQACPVPPQPTGFRDVNIFNDQQEMDLGDAIAEQFQREFRIIEEEELTGYLNRIAERLAQKMPWTKIKFRVFVFDLPTVNAFAFPGGRIYLSRKLIAAARNEDEIAGVIAHEMGHVITKQVAVELTASFREILGVTSVNDRADILEKYHQLIENARRGRARKHSSREEQREQLEADNAGLFAVAAAGYSPQAYADFWNRAFDVKGKTGNWFSDFLGATKPESRRLREMLRFVGTMPPGCMKTAAAGSAEFTAWRSAVVAYSGLGRKESLHSVLMRRTLEPPLQGDLNHFRFSPDGKYAIAQDDSSIFVLRREPFESAFRIDAQEAEPAQFSADSKFITFFNEGLRVEKWNVEDEERESVHELTIPRSCLQASLSPDAATLACLTDDKQDLLLYDVATGSEIFAKKNFYTMTWFQASWLYINQILGNDVRLIEMKFSPDSKYLVAGRYDKTIAVDVQTKDAVDLPGSVKKILARSFTFLAPDRLIGVGGRQGEKTAVVKFPTGEQVTEVAVGNADLFSPGRGDYVVLRPISNYPVGVMNLATKKVFMANKKPAFDIFDRVYLSERTNGEVALYSADSDQVVGVVRLPRGTFGRLRAVAASDDLNWLAVSERSRGAVWNLSRNQRPFLTRGFRGAHFDGTAALLADYPEFEQTARGITRLDLKTLMAQQILPLGKAPKKEEADGDDGEGAKEKAKPKEKKKEEAEEDPGRTSQHGPYLITDRPLKKGSYFFGENIRMDVKEVASGKVLWTQSFQKEAPDRLIFTHGGTMVFLWPVGSNAAKAQINESPEMKRRLAAMKEKDGDYYIEVLEVGTGKRLGQLLVETGKGSFRIGGVFAVGDRAVVTDTQNRILIYSLADGELKGRLFGAHATVNRQNGLLCVENESGKLAVYDLATMQKRDEFIFSSPVSWLQFNPDGSKLLVLTANQTAYVLVTKALSGVAAATN